MDSMKPLLRIAADAFGGFTWFACNYTVGDCYPRGQGSDSAGAGAGVGGGSVLAGGVGGFGDMPPRQPRDATNSSPGCNRVTQSESSECDDKYQDCINNGPTSCLKKVAGKTLCYRCWERCNAGDSPSSQCRNCKF